jgi:hypothetical protein
MGKNKKNINSGVSLMDVSQSIFRLGKANSASEYDFI